jgi:hypothetical protein
MWSRHPSHTNAKVKQCLEETAVKLGAGTFNNSWGHGRVDALAALKCGDLVFPPSLVTCPTRIVVCRPKSTIVACVSTLTCPSRLPRLCTTSIRQLCGEVPSAVVTCPSLLRCPSAVDGCPSSLGCSSAICGFPGDLTFDPGVLRTSPAVVGRVAGLQARVEAEKPASGFFYVDDDGTIHEA